MGKYPCVPSVTGGDRQWAGPVVLSDSSPAHPTTWCMAGMWAPLSAGISLLDPWHQQTWGAEAEAEAEEWQREPHTGVPDHQGDWHLLETGLSPYQLIPDKVSTHYHQACCNVPGLGQNQTDASSIGPVQAQFWHIAAFVHGFIIHNFSCFLVDLCCTHWPLELT